MARRTLIGAILIVLAASLLPANAGASERSRYIVVLNNTVGDPGAVAREHARNNGARVGHVYRHALKGYSANMSAVAAARLADDDRVSFVEPDGIVHKSEIQSGAPWGLARIDQPDKNDLTSYFYDQTGAGVTAYIIDSGVSPHDDFTGRLDRGPDFVDGGSTGFGDSDGSLDCDGHGTHVAGTVGGARYGVAKAVRLVGVRVLDCSGSGTWSGVIAGINWVTGEHAAGELSVANMSLGGGASSSVDTAVSGSIEDGVTYAVAAGNGNSGGKAQDACGYSPARVPTALTVGATSNTDTKASWSNYGTCLDLFAPGVDITSTTMNVSDPTGVSTSTDTWSGTSMATPHVAGVAALYLDEFGATSPAEVAGAIVTQATGGVVSSAGSGSPNKLLYSLLNAAAAPPPAEEPPPASGETVTVSDAITQALSGGKNASKDLSVTVTVTDPNHAGVGGAAVSVSITRKEGGSWTATGTTGSEGHVSFKLSNARSGCYVSTVRNVAPSSSTQVWDGVGAVSAEKCK